MDEPEPAPDIHQRMPDYLSALEVLKLASEMLEQAEGKMETGDFPGAIEDSKNVMRMSASAVLFRDGFIAPTFDATQKYLDMRYPSLLPLDEWGALETRVTGEGPGITNLLARVFGKGAQKSDAGFAIGNAKRFLEGARDILGM